MSPARNVGSSVTAGLTRPKASLPLQLLPGTIPGAVLCSSFGGGRKYDLTVLGLRLADDSPIMVGRSAPLPLVGCLMLSVDYRCTWRTAAPRRGSPARSDSRCGRCGL